MPDEKRANRIRESYAKANAEFQKITSTVLTLSLGVVALPLLFFKDVFKENVSKGESVQFFLMSQPKLVVALGAAAILLLGLAVFSSLRYTAWSGYLLKQLYQKDDPETYIDDESAGALVVRKMDAYFVSTTALFVAGFVSMMAFVVFYKKVSSDPKPPEEISSARPLTNPAPKN
jgi:hypothetical protein